MNTLAAEQVKWLIDSVSKEHNSTYLIQWLRDGRNVTHVTPKLMLLIADILEGKVKARRKPDKKLSLHEKSKLLLINPKETVKKYQDVLKNLINKSERNENVLKNLTNESKWNEIYPSLIQAGYTGIPESKGEITKAAKLLACREYGLKLSQLDELYVSRKSRKTS